MLGKRSSTVSNKYGGGGSGKLIRNTDPSYVSISEKHVWAETWRDTRSELCEFLGKHKRKQNQEQVQRLVDGARLKSDDGWWLSQNVVNRGIL